MRIFLLLLLALLIPWLANGHPNTDMKILRNVVCAYETRGEVHPDQAVGKSNEVGGCQVLPATAHQMGFRGSLETLAQPRFNRAIALAYLNYCARRLGTQDPERLLHCYNGGPNLPWEGLGPARRYAAAVLVLYRRALIAQAVAIRTLYKEVWL